MSMRRPEGSCSGCWQPRHDGPCWPFEATERTYGNGDDGDPTWTTDRFESFVLDASNPRINTKRGANGFLIEEAKVLAAALRQAFADGVLTIDDLTPAPPAPEDGGA